LDYGEENKDDRKPQDWKIRQYYQQNELVERIVKLAEYREVTLRLIQTVMVRDLML